MAAGLPWWLLPSAAALILVATHTYLGLHVISRNVFFVDLALAQVAALGSTVAFLYGYEQGDSVTYYVSLLFAVGGAWFFSVARLPDNRVPQEAIIGLTFAVASAGAILLSAENPHGAEHLRDIMAGSILVVSGKEVLQAAGLYGAIGLFHWRFRRPLLEVSFDRAGAEQRGLRVRWWDFLFYLSFAVVITSSVRIAGVLLVFILLIAPAVCGAMFATGIRARLLLGWGCGILATIGGLLLSSGMDWPPAPAISCIFAAILIGSGVVDSVLRSARPALSVARFAGGSALLCGLGFGLVAFLRSGADSAHSHGGPEHALGGSRQDLISALSDEHDNVRASAAEKLGKLADPEVLPQLMAALQDRADAVKEKAAEAIGALGRPEAVAALEAALEQRDQDEWVHLREAEALVRCGGQKGMNVLLQLANDADARLVRVQALQKALAFAGQPALAADAADAPAALQRLRTWWAANGSRAHWDPASARFSVER
ncbi:MAG: iron chelate uptake ABC transporter family permease subunit [Deltaproteobacteria bacterium]